MLRNHILLVLIAFFVLPSCKSDDFNRDPYMLVRPSVNFVTEKFIEYVETDPNPELNVLTRQQWISEARRLLNAVKAPSLPVVPTEPPATDAGDEQTSLILPVNPALLPFAREPCGIREIHAVSFHQNMSLT